MPSEIFELQHWEAWEVPASEGRPSGLRITTDVVLPFAGDTLLKVSLGTEGFEIHAPDLSITVLLTPRPGPKALALFEQSLAFFLPVALTEVDFPNQAERTWLAAPARAKA